MPTYKPSTAFNRALRYLKNMPLQDVQLPILTQISNMMWMYAPWRWTLGSLPVITVASATQDYVIALPADFLFATDAYLADGDNQVDTILVEPALPANVKRIGWPKRLAITGTPGQNGTLRLGAIPGTLTSPPDIISLYKLQAPVLTPQTMQTPGVLLFPDEWSWVYEMGVLWQAYVWGDDSRAGGATATSEGQMQFSGQRGTFEAALIQMRDREKLPEGEVKAKSETRKTRG